ncbi:hypothetical protein SAMN04489730_6891 [Amycolatopsis australiensis]|uniref:Uncharacterized protein n=2 Tax=Amycolatopsis australiensis TaxID=546364 RepID=A0A1K1SVW6_9PSEU|nr:hypothetical protein SAMN04489730_6891 [Amycolatopsis australiensis]
MAAGSSPPPPVAVVCTMVIVIQIPGFWRSARTGPPLPRVLISSDVTASATKASHVGRSRMAAKNPKIMKIRNVTSRVSRTLPSPMTPRKLSRANVGWSRSRRTGRCIAAATHSAVAATSGPVVAHQRPSCPPNTRAAVASSVPGRYRSTRFSQGCQPQAAFAASGGHIGRFQSTRRLTPSCP